MGGVHENEDQEASLYPLKPLRTLSLVNNLCVLTL